MATEATKRIREIVANLEHPDTLGLADWVETGKVPLAGRIGWSAIGGASLQHSLNRAAIAIAEAEERGTPGAQRKAWEEGYTACLKDAVDALDPGHECREVHMTKNPYPAPEKADG